MSERLTPRGHRHAEAFCLMWYGCVCGHRERIWNSRDGVTPFGLACPSCDDNGIALHKRDGGLYHIAFGSDTYAPSHKPHDGQRIWVDMTRERATALAERQMGRHGLSSEERKATLIEIYLGTEHGGGAPDLKVNGYEECA